MSSCRRKQSLRLLACSVFAASFAGIATGTAISAEPLRFDLDGDGASELALPAGADPAGLPGDRNQDGILDLAPPASRNLATASPPGAREHDREAVWDARDELGRAVPRGVYWLRIGSGRSGATAVEAMPLVVIP